ncbi:MAG: hypothetical protein E6767_08105 [Dysgonomonas sp.]|nr:hypothetical protein [Dysgonomonas sp.]
MLRVLLKLIDAPDVNRWHLFCIFKIVWNASFQYYDEYKNGMSQTLNRVDDLLNTDLLWDDFIDEEEDEMAWEKYEYSEQDWFNCCCLCLDLFEEHKNQIEKYIDSSDEKVREIALYLIDKIDKQK